MSSPFPGLSPLRFQPTRAQFPFIAVSREGENSIWTYELEAEHQDGADSWIVRARPADARYDGNEWYEVCVQVEAPQIARVITVNNGLPLLFAGRGVAPALYPLLAARLRSRLYSSRNAGGDPGEYRAARIDGVWQFLHAKGKAEYDAEADEYVIDGRNGHEPPGSMNVLEANPTNEAEFQALMERIDAVLRAREAPLIGRQMGGVGEISLRLSEGTIPMLAKGDPLPGVYEGIDLVIRAHLWFDNRYGSKLLMDLSPGSVALMLGGDLWVMKLPLLIGRWTLIANRDAPAVGDVIRRDEGQVEAYNVIDAITALPEGLRASLTDADLGMCLHVFQTALGAFRALRDCHAEPLIAEALSDHQATLGHLEGHYSHPGQARWSSLQAVEKILKAYIIGAGAPPAFGHHLPTLVRKAEACGLIPPDPYFTDIVQCEAGVRYGADVGTLEQAIQAHHSALELTWYLGDELRELRFLPRRTM